MILVLVEVAKNTNSVADDKKNQKQIKSQTIKLKKTQTAIFYCLSFFYS